MGGNHQKLRENSGKMILRILYEPFHLCMRLTAVRGAANEVSSHLLNTNNSQNISADRRDATASLDAQL